MKKIKYLLALCLSILCIGAVSANAAVHTTMADEITLFENLGFTLPEKTNETDAVTRGEFIGTLVQLLNRDFAPGGEYSFQDVNKTSELSGVLNYAVAMGIVSDDTLFNPDTPITYPQAMKMAVAFLGRGTEAEAAGGFPSGYTSVASTVKLYAGLQDANGDSVTLRDFYKILYNTGQADMLMFDGDKGLYNGGSPFEEYFNMYEIRGVVTHSDRTSLADDQIMVPNDVVSINGTPYRYDGDVPMGYNVDGWASYVSGDMREIVLIKKYKNEIQELGLANLSGRIEGNRFVYENAGRDEKIKLDNAVILYNGIAAPTMNVNDVLSCKLGTATFIDNDADGSYEVIDVWEYRPIVISVTSAMSMRIVDKNGAPAVDLDKAKEYKLIKGGEAVALSQLAKDEFAVVYESKNGKYVTVEVLESTVSGNVTSYNASGNTIKLDDTSYPISNYFKTNFLSKIVYNTEIDAFVGPDGVIHALTTVKGSVTKYGLALRWGDDLETEDLIITMVNEECEVIRVRLPKGKALKLDGQSARRTDVINRLEVLKGRGMENLFFKYELNSDGTEIKVIDTYNQLTSENDPQNILKGDEDVNDNMTEWNFPSWLNDNPFWNKDRVAWVGVLYPQTTKVFQIYTDADIEDEDRLRVGTTSIMSEDPSYLKRKPSTGGFAARNYRVFNVDRYANAEAILISYGAPDATVSGSDERGIVYRISKAVNLDDEVTYEIVVFTNGEYKTYFLTEDYYDEITNGAGLPCAVGDYVGYKLYNNEIMKLKLEFDHSTKAPASPCSCGGGEHNITSSVTYMGWIYDTDGTNISVIDISHGNNKTSDITTLYNATTGKLNPSTELVSFPLGSVKITVVSPDGKALTEGTLGDLVTFVQAQDEADSVITRFDNNLVLREVILYK